ncbi:MAG TPA: bifunctional (p)ppGpp synthetase/guanosine-3',5'-bis(diphosphate) 3'-pyrophosphohydrolase [Spirochaetota bacterium]|nr:bifunctional (p)ppGpp synthetase/guanosine-3',5'-bis(diphosphate) 3'-pyrophosphohydrolase [Spirochaetota bacterium]
MSEYNYNDIFDLFEDLLQIISVKHPDIDVTLIKKAFAVAESAHRDQKRLSGEPYIIHPINVAIILAKHSLDSSSIIAALLHDVVEDTVTGLDSIADTFGSEIALLVDGVTKISSLKNRTKSHEQAQTLRKMLLATIDDPRVIIIKLADKTHNMRTLEFQPKPKQLKIAQEVMDIYAPLAGRLGMSKIRSELEDLAFYILHRDEFLDITAKLSKQEEELDEYLNEIHSTLHSNISKMNIKADISGRIKHLYSIYKKMVDQQKPFEEIFDVRAIRIITEEVKDCYAILGIVHTIWPPVPSRFKDYIAVPKSNMYQSLHTTVTGPGKHFLEIQIRTKEMDITAEMGIAAHWMYKENGKKEKSKMSDLSLLKSINKWRSELNDTREFMKVLKMDLYNDEIFVFTPKGKIIRLAKGATPIDFAYAIHSEVGHHCSGAKINHKIKPLRTKLSNGDIVEITTNPAKHPSENWLKIVRSSNARYKIRSWLKKQQPTDSDEASSKSKKDTKSEPDKIASFTIDMAEMPKISKSPDNLKSGILVEDNNNVPIRLAQCCQPIPGDPVIGFISKDKRISVHKKGCPSLKRLNIEPERFISIAWSNSHHVHPVKIAIEAIDRPNLLADITTEISQSRINIMKLEAQESKAGFAVIRLIVEVKSVDHLHFVIDRLKSVKDVVEVYKLKEKVIKRK